MSEPLHVLLVADGRSPITRRWAQGLLELGWRVSLLSTYPCPALEGAEALRVVPVAFGSYSGAQVDTLADETAAPKKPSASRKLVNRFRGLMLGARYALGPSTLPAAGRELNRWVRELRPDIVHALRIPFEGMLAAYTPPGVPLAVSIWGNDLTLHAHGSAGMAAATRRTLLRADGLLADARRDLRLASMWGFDPAKPAAVLPGAGGLDLAQMECLAAAASLPLDIEPGAPLVLNPRGLRPGSVRTDIFFQAAGLVAARRPEVRFVCAAMAGQHEALEWVARLHLAEQVRLLPYLPQQQLWGLFQRAQVSVSISQHDGTPNSLLEAMALGCFPVAGDIESTREWITPGVNGLLVEPSNAGALAEALLTALDSADLRRGAAQANRRIIAQRAEIGVTRARTAEFYGNLVIGGR